MQLDLSYLVLNVQEDVQGSWKMQLNQIWINLIIFMTEIRFVAWFGSFTSLLIQFSLESNHFSLNRTFFRESKILLDSSNSEHFHRFSSFEIIGKIAVNRFQNFRLCGLHVWFVQCAHAHREWMNAPCDVRSDVRREKVKFTIWMWKHSKPVH